MFERLIARAERRAEKRAAYRIRRLAEAVRSEGVRGVQVRVEGLSLILSGRAAFRS
jgi:hypothetical protein